MEWEAGTTGFPHTGSVTEADGDLPMRGQRFGFATLERARAAEDLQDLEALRDHGRRAGRVYLDDLRKVTA